jgi:Flp pilus assembly protein TadG
VRGASGARAIANERGSVAIAGMLLSFALALLVGAGVDFAHAFIVREELSAIADDAALAGAGRLDLTAWREGRLALDPQAAVRAVQAELAANPGVSGSVSAAPASVSVAVERSFPTFALRLVGISTLRVSAHAVASPETP